jgi:hypothetical protein
MKWILKEHYKEPMTEELVLWKDKQDRQTWERGCKLITLDMKSGILQQIPMKSRGSFGSILKTYILINWKI